MKTYFEFEEANGIVRLTERQRDIVIMVAKGQEAYNAGGKGIGSSVHVIKQKIRKGTSWEMRFCQMCCRFAYKHGLVRL